MDNWLYRLAPPSPAKRQKNYVLCCALAGLVVGSILGLDSLNIMWIAVLTFVFNAHFGLYNECVYILLLRKIALPYPHKCLFGFVEQNVSTDKNFLRNILVTRGDPFVCACPRLRSSRCRQTIVESSSLYFWSIWEHHVFFLIIVHSRMKIYEVLKRASVHLPVVIHYSTGTTTNSASLVLKRVRIRCARRCCCKVFSGRRVYLPPYSPIIRLELPPCR